MENMGSGEGQQQIGGESADDLMDICELQERQVAFVVGVWEKKDENYPTLSRAVLRDVREALNKARKLESGADRTELVHRFERMRSVLDFLDDRHYILNTWSGSTSRHSQSVRSVFSGGLPGMGK